MNRREALKAVVGTAAVGFAGAEMVGASTVKGVPGVPTYAPSNHVPKDVRTPEQIWADNVEDTAQSILNDQNDYYHYTRYAPPEVMTRIKEMIIATGREPETITMYDQTGLVVNGNVILNWRA